MSKNKKHAVKVDAVPVDAVKVDAVAPVNVTTIKVNMADTFERYSVKFLVSLVLSFINGTSRDISAMLAVTVDFILSTITLKVGTVYCINRPAFLNIMCRVNGISPSLSKYSNKSGNKTYSMYGQGIVGTFDTVFDVDTMYTRLNMVNGFNTFVHGGVNVFHIDGKVFIMHHDTFTAFVNGEVTVDIDAVVIDAPSTVPVMWIDAVDVPPVDVPPVDAVDAVDGDDE